MNLFRQRIDSHAQDGNAMVCNTDEGYAERDIPKNILDDFPAVKRQEIFF